MGNRYYDGPVSDHFDGVRFSNSGRAPDRSLRQVLRWKMQKRVSPWPATRQEGPRDRPPPRSDRARIAFVGHASILLQVDGLNLLFDPVWSERVSPFRRLGPRRIDRPGIDFDALPKIDAVLVTHNHYDHMDLDTLRRLEATHRPLFVTPLGNDTILRRALGQIRVETGDWGDRVALSERVEARFTPANHWSARGVRDRRMALWSGFTIAASQARIYHSGDTGYGDGAIFREIGEGFGEIDLALLPIGAYEPRWFMGEQHASPADAVQMLRDCGARRALGFHWGTFDLADEGLDQPCDDLAAALDAAGIGRERFHAMRPGEHFLV